MTKSEDGSEIDVAALHHAVETASEEKAYKPVPAFVEVELDNIEDFKTVETQFARQEGSNSVTSYIFMFIFALLSV